MTTGYSGTPLAKKLGIKPGMTVLFHDAPTEILSELKSALKDARRAKTPTDNLDFIHGFVLSKSSLEKELPLWKKCLAKNGCLWISWPKKASGTETDLSGDIVRECGLNAKLVDIKVCAVDETWSGLKFVYRKEDRR
jgi:hypothetical protein